MTSAMLVCRTLRQGSRSTTWSSPASTKPRRYVARGAWLDSRIQSSPPTRSTCRLRFAFARCWPLVTRDAEVDAVSAMWNAVSVDPALQVPVGVGIDGPVELDLVADGPHALVGGTTGSGKSEFLRSFIVGLAARVSPEHLVFVLIDYKGGSAFDECSRLPHCVGLVTDLDPHLSERALTSLEAELEHRERVLREHLTPDLPSYLAEGSPGGPLPRLVVVIDEFATLATDLPEFMGALLGIAQRGRSLGVHLVLATQRPSGAVNANIKANTNIRIALRVQDPADSIDVIDRPDAAAILRSTPGRAFFRLGPGEVVVAQTPLSTLAPPAAGRAALSIGPFAFGQDATLTTCVNAPDAANDLTTLVEGCRGAFSASGIAPPRRPWLPMLEASIPLETVLERGVPEHGVIVGLADDPRHQQHTPLHWQPGDWPSRPLRGHRLGHYISLGCCDLRGCDSRELPYTSTALISMVARWRILKGAAPIGAVICSGEHERQLRLISWLSSELQRRRDARLDERSDEPQLSDRNRWVGLLRWRVQRC